MILGNVPYFGGDYSMDLGQLWVYWVYMKQIKLHFATVMFIYDNFGKCT